MVLRGISTPSGRTCPVTFLHQTGLLGNTCGIGPASCECTDAERRTLRRDTAVHITHQRFPIGDRGLSVESGDRAP